MDADQMLGVIRTTRAQVKDIEFRAGRWRDVKPERIPSSKLIVITNPLDHVVLVKHVLWMLDEMERWILDPMTMDTKRWEKLQRWLGFVQGACWVCGIFTIDAMRTMNRSPE